MKQAVSIPKYDSRMNFFNYLMALLQKKDWLTVEHSHRVELICLEIGRRIELTRERLALLSLLARSHDLGKINMPAEILFKKGPLEKEEWEIMRQHPERGCRFALSTRHLYQVADLILKHHERWDGQGYPLGLTGEDIPLECRILAIADAYDAMLYYRPYKAPVSKDKALKQIKASADTQFDPCLVEVFLSLRQES